MFDASSVQFFFTRQGLFSVNIPVFEQKGGQSRGLTAVSYSSSLVVSVVVAVVA